MICEGTRVYTTSEAAGVLGQGAQRPILSVEVGEPWYADVRKATVQEIPWETDVVIQESRSPQSFVKAFQRVVLGAECGRLECSNAARIGEVCLTSMVACSL